MKLRWPWLLLLLVPVALGLSRLRFDTEVLNLLPADLPEVRGLQLWQKHFAGAGDLLITLRTPDAGESARLAESLAASLRAEPGLAREVHWQAPWQEHRGDSAQLVAAMWLNQPPDQVSALQARLTPDQLRARLTAMREQLAVSLSPDELARLSYDPLGLLDLPGSTAATAISGDGDGPPFASNDGTFRVLHVEPPPLTGGYRAADEWFTRMKQRVARWRHLTEGARSAALGFTGGPAFVTEISRSMERDMKWSATGTALLVALLFGLAHRRLRPLLWLVTLLGVTLALTMGAAGLLFGSINVISLGFAAILLGLGVDYALVLYQERLAHRDVPLTEVRRGVAPGIGWSAATTAGAFALLNFSGLPGLAQLGSLVAAGVAISAVVMIAWFLPPLEAALPSATSPHVARHSPVVSGPGLAVASVVLAVAAACFAFARPPAVDASAAPLRPVGGGAYAVMAELRREIGGEESWPVLVTGDSEQQVADALGRLRTLLADLTATGQIDSFTLPDALWPSPQNQAANRRALSDLVAGEPAMLNAARDAGFTAESLALAQGIFATWRAALVRDGTFAPDNAVSRWLARQSIARDGDHRTAAGVIQPASPAAGNEWVGRVQANNVFIAGWDRLGPALFFEVKEHLQWVLAAIVAVQLLALWMTFRRASEVLLSVAALALGGALLLAVMSLAGWSWNLMNLMAVPLLLGATEDYSIHTQLSLRRHGGNWPATFHATGKAVLLCATTTSVGFGSLALSSNAGLASLGRVCAVGVLCAALVTCVFLPAWWRLLNRNPNANLGTRNSKPETHRPSRFYRGFFWRLGLACVRLLPSGMTRGLGSMLSLTYAVLAPDRRQIVLQNLLPACNGDVRVARRTHWRLFRIFGIKIADLLRYEVGGNVLDRFRELPTPDRFSLSAGRGTLLLTIHLGNWEFGAPLLRRLGVNLLVITLAEPGRSFTGLRERARQRQGVETLVIGQDAFAFVEVLKRLQAGAVVALLVDRPPAGSGVEVELFGRPFAASSAAAELARASGCALLPVAIPWTPAGYEVLALPEIGYDRARLGDREARRALTQEILRAFAPVIRQHPDQWFHFVPVWPE